MIEDKIEDLFDKKLVIYLFDSLFQNTEESYGVIGTLKSNPNVGFDLELFKTLDTTDSDKKRAIDNQGLLLGNKIHHLSAPYQNGNLIIEGLTAGDWLYGNKKDRAILKKNINTFSITNEGEFPNLNRITFYIDRKQLSHEQQSILHSLKNLDFCTLDADNKKFIKVFFDVREYDTNEDFSKLLFKILRFVLNGGEPNLTTIISRNEYKQRIYFPNTEFSPNGFFMPINFLANKDSCSAKLFNKLFSYIQSPEGYVLQQLLDYFFCAETSPLEVEALLYCVSIEDILRKIEPSLKIKETENYLKVLENLSILENHLSLIELDNDFRNRAKGALNMIKNLAPKNILLHLQSEYPIEEQDIKAFSDVRNRLAHNMERYEGNIQTDYDKIICLKVLIHKLIFILVGYDGNYTDYNERDFPTKEFKI